MDLLIAEHQVPVVATAVLVVGGIAASRAAGPAVLAAPVLATAMVSPVAAPAATLADPLKPSGPTALVAPGALADPAIGTHRSTTAQKRVKQELYI